MATTLPFLCSQQLPSSCRLLLCFPLLAAVVDCYVFAPPLLDFAPVIGGVTHDPIKARRRLEQARAASAIAVAPRICIHRRRRCRCHRCRRHRSSLSLPLQNAAVAFSASAIAAATAIAAIAVAAATTIAATTAVVDCYVFVTPTP